jgi:hypothetical protein
MPPKAQASAGSPSRRIVFFHPDLGIGGAERLIIDAAVGLQELGHKVTIFTSHCDPQHSFEEARDGMQRLSTSSFSAKMLTGKQVHWMFAFAAARYSLPTS